MSDKVQYGTWAVGPATARAQKMAEMQEPGAMRVDIIKPSGFACKVAEELTRRGYDAQVGLVEIHKDEDGDEAVVFVVDDDKPSELVRHNAPARVVAKAVRSATAAWDGK